MLVPANPSRWLTFCLTALCALLLFGPTRGVRAATFTVTTTTDDPNDPGSLRAATNGAQASTDVSDTITITAEGTIPLTNGELALSNPNAIAGKTVTITGPGAGSLFVSGSHAPTSQIADGSRVFHFSNLAVNLSGVAVIDGYVNSGTQSAGGVALGGAGILAESGTLTMNNCVVEDCLVTLTGAFGGGVAGANSTMNLTNCVIASDNVSGINGSGGGGIGGILGSLTITDCTVNNNNTSGVGGGIGSLNEPLTLTRCTIANNITINTTPLNGYGGGVYSQNGVVALSDCTLSNNGASTAGGGLYLKYSSATLQGCTINGNGTRVGQGGGLNITGAAVGVTNCTFTGNNAAVGGAIYNGGALTLSNSTVVRNGGAGGAGGLSTAPGVTATVTSTILTGNTNYNGESDVINQGTLTSGGSNLLGDPNGNGFTNGVKHDQTGVSVTQAGFGLTTLADNGGPTQTLALSAGSPAIDADSSDTTATDQRGAARPVGARNDIGAFEFGATATPNVPASFVVTNTNDDGTGSLRRAVNNADANPSAKIVFDPSVFGPGMPRTITLTSGPLIARQDMTITGPGQNLLAISGNHASRVLNIQSGATPILSGLTITGGNDVDGVGGGGIVVNGGLTMTDCTITGNTGGQGRLGGGIYVQSTATLTRCTITNNSAPGGFGGGVGTLGTLTMTDCTLAGNSAAQGGGFYTSSNFVFLYNCTLSGNSATSGGGAYSNTFLFLTNCTVSGNTATSGGGIGSDAAILLFSSTVSANSAGTGSGLNNESGATISVFDSILAGNTGSANIANAGTITSGGSNLIGDPDGNGFTGDPNHADPNSAGNHDQTGVTNPGLGTLANNGGPTQTMALLVGSPAIDADFVGIGTTDQRGIARPQGVRHDIGAFEYGALFAVDEAYTVRENTALTVAAPGVLANDNSDGSALTAVAQTQPAHGQLMFNGDGSFTYTPNANFLGMDSFTYQAQDAGGQTSTATVTLTVSNAAPPPTTTATLAGTLGNNSYYRSAVTVTLTATDPSNGTGGAITTTYAVDGGTPQSYSAPFTVSRDGLHTITFSSAGAQSGAGPSGSVTFKIDATPPTLTFGTPMPAPNASGFNKGSVSIPYTVTDATSGVASATPGSPLTFTTEGAGQTQTVTVTDNAGNSATFTSPAVSIDLTPPVTTAASQSTIQGQQVTLAATDNLSGVAAKAYTVDGGTATPYTTAFTVTGNGPHTVAFSSTDKAGNTETAKTLTFTLNITAPITTAALAGPQGQNGFYTGNVTVTLSASSQSSTVTGTFYTIDGGPQQTYTAPFTVTGNAKHTVTFFSTDAAGNTEAVNTRPVPIDATPPVTSGTVSGAQVTLSATDNLSGVAATTYAIDGGASASYTAPFSVTGAGAHTVTFHSTDNAGNAEADKTLSVTLAPATPPVLHTFPTGLQMFSAPEDFSGLPLSQTLSGPGHLLAVWEPNLLQYAITPTATADALRSGQGYWARFVQPTDLYDLGAHARTDQPFSIALKRGWNMIGDPFFGPVALSAVRVLDGAGHSYASADANAAGLIFPILYTFTAGDTQYRAVNLGTSLTPYQGYWVYALQPCTLSIPPAQ